MRSELKTDRNGQPAVLYVWYQGRGWDEAITEARRRHGFESKPITVLAFPVPSMEAE